MVDLPRRKLLGALGVSVAAASSGQVAWAATPSTRARRVVSIGGALTEIIYALGSEKELVGVDTTSLFPSAATRLPSVGYARALSSEGILALAPTLVVATEDAGPPAVLKQVGGAGVTVATLAANHQFEGVIDRITRLGNLLDCADRAHQLNNKLKGEWQSVRQSVLASKAAPPRVLFVLSMSPSQLMVGGRGSSAEAMIEYAGARNAITGMDGFKPLTTEAVIAAQPDVVLFTDQGLEAMGGVNAAMKIPGLQQTPAGRQRRIVSMETMFLLGFGPRLPAAVATLNREIVKVAGR